MIPLTLIPADEARRMLLETPPVGTERVPLTGGPTGQASLGGTVAVPQPPGDKVDNWETKHFNFGGIRKPGDPDGYARIKP